MVINLVNRNYKYTPRFKREEVHNELRASQFQKKGHKRVSSVSEKFQTNRKNEPAIATINLFKNESAGIYKSMRVTSANREDFVKTQRKKSSQRRTVISKILEEFK